MSTRSIPAAYGSVFIGSDGSYSYVANANLDALGQGDTATDQVTFTITDSLGRTQDATLTFNVTGSAEAPTITGGVTFASITEDAGPSTAVNGGFETGDLTGWFATSGVSTEFTGFGGPFGNYDALLGSSSGSLEQDIATTAGAHYTLTFYLAGDPEATTSSFTAFWDGAPILSLTNVPLAYTQYSFDVVGDALDPTTQFFVDYTSDGTGQHFDALSLTQESGPRDRNGRRKRDILRC